MECTEVWRFPLYLVELSRTNCHSAQLSNPIPLQPHHDFSPRTLQRDDWGVERISFLFFVSSDILKGKISWPTNLCIGWIKHEIQSEGTPAHCVCAQIIVATWLQTIWFIIWFVFNWEKWDICLTICQTLLCMESGESKDTTPNLNSSTWTEHIIVLDLCLSLSLCNYPKGQTNLQEQRWYCDVDFHT